ncbi:MAG: hypothetical protein Q9187_005527 [Circinaria calcarea]
MSSMSLMSTPAGRSHRKSNRTAPGDEHDSDSLRKRTLHRVDDTGHAHHVLLFLIAFRVLNALSIKTFFQPDEYFQSLEPAWQMAFGIDSGAWITWEWKYRLRSAVHPAIFALFYSMSSLLSDGLRLSPASHAELLISTPKVVQSVFAALGDYYTWRLARKVYGRGSNEAWAVLALSVFSPWQWFCSTRTLSNCLETTLTTVALYWWPWHWSLDTNTEGGVDLDGLRANEPTAVLHRQADQLSATLVLVLSTAFDRIYYQQWTFPPLRFLYFNVARSLAVIYGRNDWHYYWSQGYPLLLTTFLPFAVKGLYDALFLTSSIIPSECYSPFSISIRRQLATVALIVPMVLSLVSHKEVRFIYPILPICHVLAASSFVGFVLPAISFTSPFQNNHRNFLRKLVVLLLLTINLSITVFTTRYHQPGPLSILTYLRKEYIQNHLAQPPFSLSPPESNTTMTVGFLMPCHSTPWRSHLIFPGIKAWALGCEPPVELNATARATYLDEADQFYADPALYLDANLGNPPRTTRSSGSENSRPDLGLLDRERDWAWDGKAGKKVWPAYLVFFEQLEPAMGTILTGTDYRPCWRGWNSFFHDDWRRRGDVVVWCFG